MAAVGLGGVLGRSQLLPPGRQRQPRRARPPPRAARLELPGNLRRPARRQAVRKMVGEVPVAAARTGACARRPLQPQEKYWMVFVFGYARAVAERDSLTLVSWRR